MTPGLKKTVATIKAEQHDRVQFYNREGHKRALTSEDVVRYHIPSQVGVSMDMTRKSKYDYYEKLKARFDEHK